MATKDQRSLAEGHFGDPKLQNSGSRRARRDAEYMRQGSGALVHLAMANDIEGTHGFAGCKSQPHDITYEVLVLCCKTASVPLMPPWGLPPNLIQP